MPQTTYTNDLSASLAGMLADDGAYDIVSYAAAEAIPPGRQCVLNSSNTLELPQDTSYAKPVGVSCYLSASPPGTYAIGDMVPCVRRGRVWAETTGSAPGQLVEANVNHSSTVATDRGKFTTSVVSAGVGTEVADAGPVAFVKPAASGNLALVEVNFPGNQTDDDARLDALETDAGTTNACAHIALASFTAGDATPLAKFASASTPTFGLNFADAKALNIRWNNDAAPGTALCQFSLPADLDDTKDAELEFLCSKSGATVGDATTLTIAAYISVAGDLHDADTNCGGVTGALVGNATAKTTASLSRTIAAADIQPGARSMSFSVTPTAGTLGTDDLMIHSVRFRYARKLQTS